MTVRSARELMSAPAHLAPASTTVSGLADAMHRLRVNALPLVEGGAVVGLVTRRAVDDAARLGLGDAAAAAIAGSPPSWVPPTASLADVQRVLTVSGARLVLVGDPAAAPLGVITRSAVFRALSASAAAPSMDLSDVVDADDAEVLSRLAASATRVGARLFLVGGAVRDALLGRPVGDLDLVVAGDAGALGQEAVSAWGGALTTHPAFGTCTWTTADGRQLDLVSARTEHYPARASLPEVAPSGLRHDLLRRDFTVNAMALEITPEGRSELIDVMGGRADLERGVVRVLHGVSLHDDPTRIFRAARFAGRLAFDLEAATASQLQHALGSGALTEVTLTRIGAEFDKLFAEERVADCLDLLMAWGVLPALHAEWAGDEALGGRIRRVVSAWERWHAAHDIQRGMALWTALGLGLTLDARQQMADLARRSRGALRHFLDGPGAVARALATLGVAPWSGAGIGAALEGLRGADLLCVWAVAGPSRQDAVAWWLDEGYAVRSDVTAASLIAKGIAPGPALGRALSEATAHARDRSFVRRLGADPPAAP